MKGWQLEKAGEPLTLAVLPDPTPGRDEVVIEPRSAGLCHSDCGFIDGSLTEHLGFMPIILGHEIAGVITAVGEGVTDFEAGDRVAIKTGVESPGTRSHGGFATKVLSPVKFVVRIPDAVSFDDAAVATDAGITSYRALKTVGGVEAGCQVGIIGLGGVGMFGAQLAAALGATVHVADPNQEALSAARHFGFARYVSDAAEMGGADLDVVVDFAGYGTTTADAIKAVRPGGRVVQVGLGRTEATIPTALLVVKEVQLLGSLGGSAEDLAAVLELLAAGSISPVVTTIGFDDVPSALGRLAAGGVVGRMVARISTEE